MSLPRMLALTCLILSQGIIIISYLIAIQYDHPKVEVCNPYFQGCLNITDAGIFSPEGYVFRGGMITACAFFIMWWMINHTVIRQKLQATPNYLRASTTLGVIGSISLIISTALLIPPRGAIDWKLHVICATSFFLIMFFAQLIDLIIHLKEKSKLNVASRSMLIKKIAVGLQGIMIVAFLALEAMDTGDDIRNAIEWWLALLVAVYFGTTYWDWKSVKVVVSDR